MMSESYARRYWEKNYGGLDKYLALAVHSEIVEYLARVYDVIGKVIMDVGGGPGVQAKLLQERYYAEVFNLDCSQYALSALSHEIKNVQIDLGEVPWELPDLVKPGEVDLIFSIQTLEHIPLPLLPKIFNEMNRWLRPAGYCFISVATEENQDDDTHVSLYPLEIWYILALSSGFIHDYLRERIATRFDLPRKLRWQCLFLQKLGGTKNAGSKWE